MLNQTEPEIDASSVGQYGLCSKELITRSLGPGRRRIASSHSVYQLFTKIVASKKVGIGIVIANFCSAEMTPLK